MQQGVQPATSQSELTRRQKRAQRFKHLKDGTMHLLQQGVQPATPQPELTRRQKRAQRVKHLKAGTMHLLQPRKPVTPRSKLTRKQRRAQRFKHWKDETMHLLKPRKPRKPRKPVTLLKTPLQPHRLVFGGVLYTTYPLGYTLPSQPSYIKAAASSMTIVAEQALVPMLIRNEDKQLIKLVKSKVLKKKAPYLVIRPRVLRKLTNRYFTNFLRSIVIPGSLPVALAHPFGLLISSLLLHSSLRKRKVVA